MVAPRSAIGREHRRRWRRRVRLGRLLACLGLGSWDCGATGRPAPGALCFSAFCELPWSSGPWCFVRCAITGPWAGGRILTAMYMAPAAGWALPWHLAQLPVCWLSDSEAPSSSLAFCERPTGPLHRLNFAPFIRVGMYYRTTIEHKNAILEPVKKHMRQVRRPAAGFSAQLLAHTCITCVNPAELNRSDESQCKGKVPELARLGALGDGARVCVLANSPLEKCRHLS